LSPVNASPFEELGDLVANVFLEIEVARSTTFRLSPANAFAHPLFTSNFSHRTPFDIFSYPSAPSISLSSQSCPSASP